MDFLQQCVINMSDEKSIQRKLHLFIQSLHKIKATKNLLYVDPDFSEFQSPTWLQSATNIFIAYFIQHCLYSKHEQITFIECLSQLKLNPILENCLDFSALLNMLLSFNYENAYIDFNFVVISDKENYKKEVENCIENLMKMKKFDCALKLAFSENINPDQIVIKEWQYKFDNQENITNILEECNIEFRKNNVNPLLATDFFLSYLNKFDEELIKYDITNFALKWASTTNYMLDELERKAWILYFKITEMKQTVNFPFNRSNMIYFADMLEELDTKFNSETQHKDISLDIILKTVKDLLDKESIWEALKVEKMFSCHCEDLLILKFCFSLAEEITSIFEMNEEYTNLIESLKITVESDNLDLPSVSELSSVCKFYLL